VVLRARGNFIEHGREIGVRFSARGGEPGLRRPASMGAVLVFGGLGRSCAHGPVDRARMLGIVSVREGSPGCSIALTTSRSKPEGAKAPEFRTSVRVDRRTVARRSPEPRTSIAYARPPFHRMDSWMQYMDQDRH
jgi:hypothetical protein